MIMLNIAIKKEYYQINQLNNVSIYNYKIDFGESINTPNYNYY